MAARDGSPGGLVVEGLSVAFAGNVVLGRVDATFGPGFTGVFGPNGAGKTTFFNAITGYVRAASGDVRLDGESLVGLSPVRIARRGVSRTFQTARVVPELTVVENVLAAQRFGRGALQRRLAEELLQRFNLQDLAAVPAGEIPLAKLKLVEIARALLTKPQVLLLDEPAAGLSAEEVDDLVVPLGQWMAEAAAVVILVEHDLQLISRLCSYAYMLNFGRVFAEGTPEVVLRREDVLSAYLGVGHAA